MISVASAVIGIVGFACIVIFVVAVIARCNFASAVCALPDAVCYGARRIVRAAVIDIVGFASVVIFVIAGIARKGANSVVARVFGVFGVASMPDASAVIDIVGFASAGSVKVRALRAARRNASAILAQNGDFCFVGVGRARGVACAAVVGRRRDIGAFGFAGFGIDAFYQTFGAIVGACAVAA